MILSFSSKGLRSICRNSRRLTERYGAEASRALISRLSDIRAAQNAADLVMLGKLVEFDQRFGTILFFATNDVCLQTRIGHVEVPRLSDDRISWESVSRLQIMDIGEKK